MCWRLAETPRAINWSTFQCSLRDSGLSKIYTERDFVNFILSENGPEFV